MDGLVQIKTGDGWHTRRMKDSGVVFQAKLSDGGGMYFIKYPDGTRSWHVRDVVERLSEEVKP